MTFDVTAIYAAVLALIGVGLTIAVIRLRRTLRISIFHNDNTDLAFATRRHSNFMETVPIALILMGLMEARGLSPIWLHAMGVTLVAARLLHIIGLRPGGSSPWRVVGMAGTLTAIIAASLYLLATIF